MRASDRAVGGMDQPEVAGIDQEAHALAKNEHRVEAVDGVGEQHDPPASEKYQKAVGITDLRARSDMIHWIRKRIEKSAWPRKPTITHQNSPQWSTRKNSKTVCIQPSPGFASTGRAFLRRLISHMTPTRS